MILYRPGGEQELKLIAQSEFTAFPPRLPEQPIFYPVLNQKYAAEIAERWNTRDPQSGYKGYITCFEITDDFISRYEVQTVGRSYHQEYWIPAEELDAFNGNLIGKIRIVQVFE